MAKTSNILEHVANRHWKKRGLSPDGLSPEEEDEDDEEQEDDEEDADGRLSTRSAAGVLRYSNTLSGLK
jgi:hypothetical protein